MMSFWTNIIYNNYIQTYEQWFMKNAKHTEFLGYSKIEAFA